jgi:endonuclease/exonuclease/phosphatase family metal-dependent hydrolase
MPSLCLITWNCHHGSLGQRLAELAAPASPDIVFLQECLPAATLPIHGQFITRRINDRKGIALGSMNPDYRLAALTSRASSGLAAVAAAVDGPISFTAIGVWGQKPNYAEDVMRTLDAYDGVLRSEQSVVMGDLNSGTNLKQAGQPSRGHSRILARLAELGLVSAYHVSHNVEHGYETHPTYRHQRKRSKPWHIDFCFVPADWDVVGVEVLDGRRWSMTSDHLPLKVEIRTTG